MNDLTNENIRHIRKDGLNYLQFRKLNEFPELVHAFTLKPLDFMSAHETKEREAKKMIAGALGIPPGALYKPRQTHSDNIRCITDPEILSPELDSVDGLITDQREVFLLLSFADCTPLLFYDPIRHVIADIHSGWRGTLQRIGAKAVRRMQENYGCDPSDLICCIGPHIRKCCFETDADVRDLFAAEFADLDGIRAMLDYDPVKNKYFIDTLSINKRLLIEAGLREDRIFDSGICTVCHSRFCQSYRSDRSDSGRAAAIIGLRRI